MSQEKTSRRDRVVMALGICALLLFAANLITMVKKHFFDSHSTEHHVVVHEVHRVPRQHVVVAPRVEHRLRIVTAGRARSEALLAMKERLLEEAERLTEEAARLAEAGHADASLSLQETVEHSLLQLQELELKLEQLPEEVLVRPAPDVDLQVEVVDPGSS